MSNREIPWYLHISGFHTHKFEITKSRLMEEIDLDEGFLAQKSTVNHGPDPADCLFLHVLQSKTGL